MNAQELWVECESCGKRANERGNGLANLCESCRLDLELFGSEVLKILRPDWRIDGADKLADVRTAAHDFGLLDAEGGERRG